MGDEGVSPHADWEDLPPSYLEATRTSANDDDNNNTPTTPTTTTAARHTLIYSIPASNPVSSFSAPRQQQQPKTRDSQTRSSGSSVTPPRQFPPAICLYSRTQRHYVLGESQHRPLYAVETHSGLLKPDLVLHSGVSNDSPSLATVDHDPFSRSASITLPPRPGSRFVAANERLESAGPFTKAMSFSIETGLSGGGREHFEWRHSSGVEVEALRGRHSGWKLVRVSVSPPPSVYRMPSLSCPVKKHHLRHASSSSLGGGGGMTMSSDSREIVAVWAGAGLSSMSKVLRFRFLGTGADGSLGERWAILAVASALAIWNRDRRSNSNTAISAGSSAALLGGL